MKTAPAPPPTTASSPPPPRHAAAPDPPLDCDTPLARRWAVLLWLLALAWLTLLAVPVLADAVQGIDDQVYDRVIAAEQDLLVAAAHFCDVFGGTTASVAIVIIVGLVLTWARRWPGLAVWLGTMALATGLNVVIKNVYERARPPQGLVEEQTYSFVSGHSLTAAALAISLVLISVPAGPRRRTWLTVAVGYALLMAASRVYLRAHWFSDTLAGVTVGAACAVSVAFAASWWQARRQEP